MKKFFIYFLIITTILGVILWILGTRSTNFVTMVILTVIFTMIYIVLLIFGFLVIGDNPSDFYALGHLKMVENCGILITKVFENKIEIIYCNPDSISDNFGINENSQVKYIFKEDIPLEYLNKGNILKIVAKEKDFSFEVYLGFEKIKKGVKVLF